MDSEGRTAYKAFCCIISLIRNIFGSMPFLIASDDGGMARSGMMPWPRGLELSITKRYIGKLTRSFEFGSVIVGIYMAELP